jgi:hypothetical protein
VCDYDDPAACQALVDGLARDAMALDGRERELAAALCTAMLAVTGITAKSLRALMTGLLDGID